MNTRKRRIVAVSHTCILSINRGIYRELCKFGWDVQIVTADKMLVKGRVIDAEPPLDIDPPIHRLRLSHSNPRIYVFEKLAELLSKLQPDIVYLESDPVSRLTLEAAKWASRHGRVPVTCLTCENLPQSVAVILKREGLRSLPSGLVKYWLNARAKKVVDHVFTINDDGTRLFREMQYKSVSKIPLGFDQVHFRIDDAARKRIRHELGLDSIVFAYFGRIVREKGVHLLLESLARIQDERWTLLLDQFEKSDEYSRQLDSQIDRLGLRKRICLFHAAHGEVANYMNAADVVVLPSQSTAKWKEQYGRVAPESMACGKLVIAARSGALPELIGEHGITFQEGDIDELSAALRSVIKRPHLIKMGEIAAAYAAENLSIQSQAKPMNNVFEALLKAT